MTRLRLTSALRPRLEALPSGWIRYVVGVAAMLQEHTGRTLTGFEGAVTSDLPTGAGLGSSAALESAFAVLWNHLDRYRLGPENARAAVPAGRMALRGRAMRRDGISLPVC